MKTLYRIILISVAAVSSILTSSAWANQQGHTLSDGSSAFGALRTYAIGYHQLAHDAGLSKEFSACSETPAAYRDANRSEQLLAQNTAGAISSLMMDAETIAACASNTNNPPSYSSRDTLDIPRPRVPLEKAYSDVGQILAITVLAQQSTGVVDGQTTANAKNAMVLLQTNATDNESMIAKIVATGLVPEMAGNGGSHAITMTAQQAVAAYKSNTFGFNSKYSGKELQITGAIENISGSGQSATVSLMGYMPKDPQDQGFQNMVMCRVGAPAQIQRVASLSKGQAVTVRGLYSPDSAFNMGSVTLLNCSLN